VRSPAGLVREGSRTRLDVVEGGSRMHRTHLRRLFTGENLGKAGLSRSQTNKNGSPPWTNGRPKGRGVASAGDTSQRDDHPRITRLG